MSDNNAKIRISLKDGEFELSGSELFVSQQIENFRELITESLKNQKFELVAPETKALPSSPNSKTEIQEIIPEQTSSTFTKTVHSFPNVFHVDGNNVKIIKKAPGGSKQAKSISTALMYMWAVNTIGQTEVKFSEIRDLCQNQGCLDPPNFAKHLKSAKEYIVINGKRGSLAQTCKITLPGQEEAIRIIEELSKK